MQVRRLQDSPASLPPVNPAVPTTAQPKAPSPNPIAETADKALNPAKPILQADSSQLDNKTGKALPTVSLMTDPPAKQTTQLTSVDIGASMLNDSNLFVKNEDDLGMTTSYSAHANLGFAHANGSKTNVFLNNRSALHTQFLAQENDLTHQSTLTSNEFEVGIRNNAWLLKSPHFSSGAKLQYKGIDTNPASGWANVQAGLHDMAHLRQYQNHKNPFVSNQSYLTPMLTLDFENENIQGKLYLKTEAQTALGTMIPLQQKRDFQTPLRADASGSVKFGYAYRDKPLIYLRAEGNLSNDPLPYNRDHGTLGSVGLAIGNEFTVLRRKNMDITLAMETKVLQPYGNFSNSPLPNQPGKHDLIHEMVNLKLQIKLK